MQVQHIYEKKIETSMIFRNLENPDPPVICQFQVIVEIVKKLIWKYFVHKTPSNFTLWLKYLKPFVYILQQQYILLSWKRSTFYSL